MQSASEFVEQLRPPGGRRSGKRDVIVRLFLGQDGHFSAEHFVDLVRESDARISRATVYRTLQWMVDAGMARRVDFGGGRFRFEHAYRHPRHFHFICRTLQSVVRVPELGHRVARRGDCDARAASRRGQSVLQIYGTCRGLPAGPAAGGAGGRRADRRRLRARCAAHCHRDRTQRPGLLHARREAARSDARGRRVFEKLAEEEKEHLGKLEARYRELMAADRTLESQPTFLFFKGAANGLFAAGSEELKKGVDDRQALLIGIRCERGSHAFFKRYGERFEESEGKRIFLEFADEERVHLELLTREYRALVARQGRRPRDGRGRQSA